MTEVKRFRFLVSGRVQGVGFRYFVCHTAGNLDLVGWVRNLSDGRVDGEVQGESDALTSLMEKLRQGPKWARIEDLLVEELALPRCQESRMEVRASSESENR